MMPPVTRRPVFWALAVAAIVLMAAAEVFTRSLNHDVAWYLYMADAFREGAELYRDVADTNPPLIVFLSLFRTPPAAASSGTTLPGAWEGRNTPLAAGRE